MYHQISCGLYWLYNKLNTSLHMDKQYWYIIPLICQLHLSFTSNHKIIVNIWYSWIQALYMSMGTCMYVCILWIEVYNVVCIFFVACACVLRTYVIKYVILVILFYALVTIQMTMGCTCCDNRSAHIHTCTHTCLCMLFWESNL